MLLQLAKEIVVIYYTEGQKWGCIYQSWRPLQRHRYIKQYKHMYSVTASDPRHKSITCSYMNEFIGTMCE